MVQKQARAELTRRRLIGATEHLVAQWGIEAVNLRDVGREAAQRNNSVVQYHFGTKELLVDAVLDLRLPELTERFEASLGGNGYDHKSLAGVVVGGLTDLAATPEGRDTIGFLSGVVTSHHWRPVLEERDDYQALLARLSAVAKSAGTPGAVAPARVKMAFVLAVVTVAASDQLSSSARNDLVEAIGGLLAAGSRQLTGSGRR